jgi:hypothetical protein
MSENALYKNLMLLGGGIDVCLEKNLIAPALILMYSAIDTSGWLDSDDEFATRDSFLNWVERYLFKAKAFSCTALELYAARCGLLHTFTSDSKLTKRGEARRACYAWGPAKAEDLQKAIDLMGSGGEYYALHVNELYEGWRHGVLAFAGELDADATRKANVTEKATRFLADVGVVPVDELLKAAVSNP